MRLLYYQYYGNKVNLNIFCFKMKVKWSFSFLWRCGWKSISCAWSQDFSAKKLQKSAGKIWKLIKKSYLCTPIWKTDGWEFLKRLTRNKKLKNFCKKIWKLKNVSYLCSPVRKRVLAREQEKFIEKTDYCTRSKYREIQFIEKR